jgi:hypothetical protein
VGLIPQVRSGQPGGGGIHLATPFAVWVPLGGK